MLIHALTGIDVFRQDSIMFMSMKIVTFENSAYGSTLKLLFHFVFCSLRPVCSSNEYYRFTGKQTIYFFTRVPSEA
jgi:hypothetical protein